MPRITRSSSSWIMMVSLCGLAGGVGAWGCGDDTSGSGGAGSTSTTATTTATTSGTTTATSSSGTTTSSTTTTTTTTTTTSSGMTPVSVTFTVDTSTMADGMYALAEVLPTEQVFMVGSFNDWNPQDPNYTLTAEAGSPGIFTITLSFPLATPGGMLDVGDMMEYKFAKTTDDGGDAWGNGMKNYFLIDDVHTCPNFPEATAGLFETGNLTLTIPDADEELQTVVIDAWRNYAESFGYNSCN